MKFRTGVLIISVAFMFAACGGSSNNPVADNGQVTDNNQPVDNGTDTPQDVPVNTDTNQPPEDEGTGVDTNVPPQDTNVQQDTNVPTDVPVTCPEGTTTGSACFQAGACALQCDDEAFRTQCLAQADQTAKDNFAAFEACVETSGCEDIFAVEQITQCVTEACKVEAEACFGVGTMTCREMWECRKDCPSDDPACPMKCFGSGSAAAQLQWIEYKNCVLGVDCAKEEFLDNGWIAWNCEQYARGYCSLPAQDCFPPL